MITEQKETTILQCQKCPDTYMKVGEIATIRLAFPRQPHRNANGQIMTGSCPKHQSERTI